MRFCLLRQRVPVFRQMLVVSIRWRRKSRLHRRASRIATPFWRIARAAPLGSIFLSHGLTGGARYARTLGYVSGDAFSVLLYQLKLIRRFVGSGLNHSPKLGGWCLACYRDSRCQHGAHWPLFGLWLKGGTESVRPSWQSSALNQCSALGQNHYPDSGEWFVGRYRPLACQIRGCVE
jgi:hypothetical protein